MMITVPYKFTPRHYQVELYKALDRGLKRAILRWHRRAGKDKACFNYIIKQAFQVPGNYFYIFPTKEEARKALWENIDKNGLAMLDHIPKALLNRVSNQEMVIELKSGKCLGQDASGELQFEGKSTIRVVGYDKDPDSVRGVSCKGAVFSEFAFSDPQAYKNLVPALRESDGFAIFESTPNGRNHYYDLWENVKDSKNWFVSELQTYWPDLPNYSGLVSPEEMEQIKLEEGYTEEDLEREFGVSFNSGLKGSYYIDFIDKAREEGRISTFNHDDTKLVNTYWDLGASDHVAIWFTQNIGNSVVCIDYYESVGESIDTLIRVLANKRYEYDTHYLPHDAGPDRMRKESNLSLEDDFNDSLNDFKVTGLVQVVSKPAKKQIGIQAVRQMFSLFCFDNFKCADGLRHLELYHKSFDKKRKIFSDDPVHDEHSHSADAFRLIAEARDYRQSYKGQYDKAYIYKSDVDIWDI